MALQIEVLPKTAAQDNSIVSDVVALVNKVYGDTEADIFVDGYQRTNEEEIRNFIEGGGLIVGYDNKGANSESNGSTQQPQHGRLVGCVHVKQTSPEMGNFSMLALYNEYRSSGAGRQLVDFAEDYCRAKGCTQMQVELLFPTTFEHQMKVRLQGWYLRRGYKITRLGDFNVDYPSLAPLLKGPTDYKVFHKDMK